MLPYNSATTLLSPLFPLLGRYLFFLLAALKQLPKEAEGVVYRGVGPEAIQAVNPALPDTTVAAKTIYRLTW
jgi:hypothetical protein